MSYSDYLSERFVEEIFKKFTIDFRNQESKRVYLVDIGTFAKIIGKDVLEAKQKDADNYMAYLDKLVKEGKLSSNTRRKKHHELSALFAFLSRRKVEFGLPDEFTNYFLNYQPAESAEKIDKILDADQIEKLLDYLKNNDLMIFIAFQFAFKGLLTTGEILRIENEDVHHIDGQPFVYVKEGTGGKRYNALTNDVYQNYLSYINGRAFGYVFSSDGSCPYEARTLQKRLAKACLEVFGKDISFTFNDIRNTGIAAARKGGADPEVIADMLGMSSRIHIERLRSGDFKLNDAAKYINIEIKPLKTTEQSKTAGGKQDEKRKVSG